MTVNVTDRAALALKVLLYSEEAAPGTVLRLLEDDESGDFKFVLDTEKDGDQSFEHQGTPVMVVSPAVNETLSGKELDLDESGRGFRLG